MKMFQDRTRMATVAVAMALTCVARGQEPSPTNRFVAEGDAPITPKPPSKITPNYIDVEFSTIAQAVGHSSGRTLVIGPGVCALVSASWETELTGEQFYQAFVSIARTLGFVVVEQGSVTKITLDDNARKDSSPRCRQYPETTKPDASLNR
jgi:type II secretory pathway component GspD/PulD (secretin)